MKKKVISYFKEQEVFNFVYLFYINKKSSVP